MGRYSTKKSCKNQNQEGFLWNNAALIGSGTLQNLPRIACNIIAPVMAIFTLLTLLENKFDHKPVPINQKY